MNAEEKSGYLKELALNLQHEGFTVGPETDGFLPVKLDDRHFCLASGSGSVRYWKEDVASEERSEALDRVTSIAEITAEYMSQLAAAPFLTANGLSGDYRLLADFNDTILAGHPTELGVQFITWDRVQNRTALEHGHYYGPGVNVKSYTAAKQDFATRSGLIPRSALFTPEQMVEIYHCCIEALAGTYPITDEQQKCLQSIVEQIERNVPDLGERLQKEQELANMEAPESGGMKFQ